MSDLRNYAAGLEQEIVPPNLADLERVATRRGRSQATTVVAAAAIAVAAIATILPGGSEGRTLPAITPSPSTTPTSADAGLDALRALTPEQVFGLGAGHKASADDGHPAVVDPRHVCAHPSSGVLVANDWPDAVPLDLASSVGGRCRTVWKVTNGDSQVLIPMSDRTRSAIPVYVGEGYFADWGGEGRPSRLVDANALKVIDLKVATTSGPPGPGRHLSYCPGDELGCIVDVRAGTLEYFSRTSLPRWLGELTEGGTRTPRGFTVAGFTSGGEVAFALLGGSAAPSDLDTPLLVSESMREAVPLTWGPELAPRAGIRWVHCPSGPCTIDVSTRTLRQIDLPEADWDRNTVGGFWGLVTSGPGVVPVTFTAVWVDASGRESRRVIPLAQGGEGVRNAAGGTTAAMTYYELHQNGSARLHVSTDRGRTWRILTVPIHVVDNLNTDSRLVPGWESWPEVG